MTRRLFICIVVVGFAAAALHHGDAQAQPYNSMTPASAPRQLDPNGPSLVFYGHQVMFADALVVGAAIATSEFSGDAVALVLPVGFLISGPMAHHHRGHNDRALYSLALRALLPLATGTLAYSMFDDTDAGDEIAAAAAVLLAMPVAAGIDWFFMSWERVERTPAAPQLAPGLMVGNDSVGLLMAGAF